MDNLANQINHGNILYFEVNNVFDKVFRDTYVDNLRHKAVL